MNMPETLLPAETYTQHFIGDKREAKIWLETVMRGDKSLASRFPIDANELEKLNALKKNLKEN